MYIIFVDIHYIYQEISGNSLDLNILKILLDSYLKNYSPLNTSLIMSLTGKKSSNNIRALVGPSLILIVKVFKSNDLKC